MSQNYRRNNEILLAIIDFLNEGSIEKLPVIGRSVVIEGDGVSKFITADLRYKFGGHIIESSMGFFLHELGQSSIERRQNSAQVSHNTLTICPMMNFPNIVKESHLKEGCPRKEWMGLISDLFDRIPSTRDEINSIFPEDSFELPRMDRVFLLVNYLKLTK